MASWGFLVGVDGGRVAVPGEARLEHDGSLEIIVCSEECDLASCRDRAIASLPVQRPSAVTVASTRVRRTQTARLEPYVLYTSPLFPEPVRFLPAGVPVELHVAEEQVSTPETHRLAVFPTCQFFGTGCDAQATTALCGFMNVPPQAFTSAFEAFCGGRLVRFHGFDDVFVVGTSSATWCWSARTKQLVHAFKGQVASATHHLNRVVCVSESTGQVVCADLDLGTKTELDVPGTGPLHVASVGTRLRAFRPQDSLMLLFDNGVLVERRTVHCGEPVLAFFAMGPRLYALTKSALLEYLPDYSVFGVCNAFPPVMATRWLFIDGEKLALTDRGFLPGPDDGPHDGRCFVSYGRQWTPTSAIDIRSLQCSAVDVKLSQ
jgi:hypothetical protein